jgi:aminoglycoside phosphotransferase (APT) family kinase protein
MTKAWKRALAAPAYSGQPRWIHGDLAPNNLIVDDNAVVAVIDWGGMAAGDPACDYALCWSLAKPGGSPIWDLATRADAATIDRARGWALSVAAIQLPYYRETNPALASQARRTIHTVLSDKS